MPGHHAERDHVPIACPGDARLPACVRTQRVRERADFAKMNEVYAARFGESRPARSTIQAKLPGTTLIEIDMVARLPQ